MLIKKPDEIKPSEITDQKTYLNRRLFMRAAVLAGTATATTLLYRTLNPAPAEKVEGEKLNEATRVVDKDAIQKGYRTSETLTPLDDITNYNNFYEFDTAKDGVAS